MSKSIGSVAELWRYPVKSMGGSSLKKTFVDDRGFLGDRIWSMIDDVSGEITSAKVFAKLLTCKGDYIREPVSQDDNVPLCVTLPDGQRVTQDNPYLNSYISTLCRHPMRLSARADAANKDYYRRRLPLSLAEMRHQFGMMPDQPLPDISVYTVSSVMEVVNYAAAPGTHFDAYPLHLLTTAALQMLKEVDPEASVDVRRFRPNILVDTPNAHPGHAEMSWIGSTLEIGEVQIRIGYPTVRCAMPGQEQLGLPRDARVANAVTKATKKFLGVYATVINSGHIALGDEVRIHKTGQTIFHQIAKPLRNIATKAALGVLLTKADRKATAVRKRTPDRMRGFENMRLVDRVAEADLITSFFLKLEENGGHGRRFLPGQHLTLAVPCDGNRQPVIRNYTVSNAPGSDVYRISVKRETASLSGSPALASNWLHDCFTIGSQISARRPLGTFFIDPTADHPLLFIAIGIGVTPMISMLNCLANEAPTRPITFLLGMRNSAEMPFTEELRKVSGRLKALTLVKLFSQPLPYDTAQGNFDVQGRINGDILRSFLSLTSDLEAALCGTPDFTAEMRDLLRASGMVDGQIRSESFWPAQRRPSDDASSSRQSFNINFARSNMAATWTSGSGSLLDLAESVGLTPPYGCRYGVCEACVVDCMSGDVEDAAGTIQHRGQVLLCSAQPKSDLTLDY